MGYRKILVPIDGSEPAKLAFDEALSLAHDTGSEIRLLHIVETQVLLSAPEAGPVASQLLESLNRTADDLLRDALGRATDAGVQADTVKVEGFGRRVSDVIVEQAVAWPADLVVMGTHGRRGWSHVMLGSDAESVARSAPVPLLLIRMKPTNRQAHGGS